jgi:hypothetical protein
MNYALLPFESALDRLLEIGTIVLIIKFIKIHRSPTFPTIESLIDTHVTHSRKLFQCH